jgi:tight adherence protein C
MTSSMYLVVAGLIFLLTLAVVLAPALMKPSEQTQHIIGVVGRKQKTVRAVSQTSAMDDVLKFAGSLRSRLGFSENARIKRRLTAAGFRGAGAADLYFAAQCFCPIVGAFAGSFFTSSTFFWVAALALIGYVAPDFWLGRKAEARKKQIRRGMSDTIDLIVICVDAGLGLDQALIRVNDELRLSHPEICEEMYQVHLEQKAGRPRLEAWKNASERTGVEEFAGFTNMLTQTERFGTPIAKALSRFADDLRMRRRQHAEEAAAKTKIKILFPLVLCIVPCLFIVLLAPALLSIISGLPKLTGQ